MTTESLDGIELSSVLLSLPPRGWVGLAFNNQKAEKT